MQAGIATTSTTTAASKETLLIHLCSKISSGNNNNNNSKKANNKKKSKYLTWYKIVPERNNHQHRKNNNNIEHYIHKRNKGFGDDCYNYSNNNHNNTVTSTRDEQIGNVDGNAGGNGSVRVVHTGNANKSRIRKSKNSYYSVNKIVLATNGSNASSRHLVNKNVVNSVNRSRVETPSAQVKRDVAAGGNDFSNVKGTQSTGKVQFREKVLNMNRSANVSFSKYLNNSSTSSKVSLEDLENKSENFVSQQKSQIFVNGLFSRAQISTGLQNQLQARNNSATNTATSATTTTTTESVISTRLDYIVITDYNRPRKRTFWQKYGE
ncbi:probable cyclin-dependent serine/threonine-protein kinase DDB_G0292550 [Rhagoletis pomonella]|uniref:probable cyclin-dependent serine/threonine-protein kinase DDB_G0292550 n=1 Tax=Rhagoletis pomonella TaxID=28610 RepID=UPI00177D375A|nr:probable cyclin-dependent serine/threonine-protein kinase DDB_G0292550 [Rhagoletis pomonella]